MKTLTPKEMKEFGEFVSSPFFNKNKNVIRLFEIIKKYYPELESEKLSKENVYGKLFPGEAYKDSSIRLLMFYLYEQVEKFLAYTKYTKNEVEYKINLLKEFNDRNLLKDFDKMYEEVKEQINSSEIRDEVFYGDNIDLADIYFSYLAKVHSEKYDKYMTKENIETQFHYLTYNYLISVLKSYAAVLNTQHLLKSEIKTELFENVLKNFDPTVFSAAPLVSIYYQVIMMILKPDEVDHYYKLKKLVLNNEAMLGTKTFGDLFVNLENYGTRRVRAGDNSFLKENYDIYKLELVKGVYKSSGYMSTAFYRSIVSVGCRLKDFDWLIDFVEKYKPEIKPELRDSIYNYCKATIEMEIKNFEKSLEYLSKVRTDELYLKMDVRMLQCRIYYELNWDDSLNSLLDAFRRTLANNKLLPESRKILFANFLKYLGKINNQKHKADELDLELIRKTIVAEDSFMQKAWILEKIDELEKEFSGKLAHAN